METFLVFVLGNFTLTFLVLGLIAAAVAGPACFLLGAAATHVYQMIVANNFEPGNAGVIFYTDIVIPIIGFVFCGFGTNSSVNHQPPSRSRAGLSGRNPAPIYKVRWEVDEYRKPSKSNASMAKSLVPTVFDPRHRPRSGLSRTGTGIRALRENLDNDS